jgi:hypothetical protein
MLWLFAKIEDADTSVLMQKAQGGNPELYANAVQAFINLVDNLVYHSMAAVASLEFLSMRTPELYVFAYRSH